MEKYAQILTIASPMFFLFVTIEKLYGWFKSKDAINSMDLISSLSSGYTNAIKDVIGIGVSLITYAWLVDHVALMHIKYTWVNVLIAFVALDFSGYWGHRINHSVNFFWNQHLIHHSSEEFNLACALRQSISGLVNFFTIFLLPAALLGVDFNIVAIIAPIHLFAQFWYHTVYIGKMGWLEHVIVTPSHHRVHHAINPIYLDKNHGQIFIFWDKWFGTFQEELADVPPVYGITTPVRTWNPIKINFVQFWQLLQDAFRTNNWQDKFRIWFMPTGWRPADVIEDYPINKIDEPYLYQKYNPLASKLLIIFSWIQFSFAFYMQMYFFSHFGQFSSSQMLLIGAFFYLSIYAYTELMDRNNNAFWIELMKSIIGLSLFIYHGGWFGLQNHYPILNNFVALYFVFSSLAVGYFVFKEFKEENLQLAM